VNTRKNADQRTVYFACQPQASPACSHCTPGGTWVAADDGDSSAVRVIEKNGPLLAQEGIAASGRGLATAKVPSRGTRFRRSRCVGERTEQLADDGQIGEGFLKGLHSRVRHLVAVFQVERLELLECGQFPQPRVRHPLALLKVE